MTSVLYCVGVSERSVASLSFRYVGLSAVPSQVLTRIVCHRYMSNRCQTQSLALALGTAKFFKAKPPTATSALAHGGKIKLTGIIGSMRARLPSCQRPSVAARLWHGPGHVRGEASAGAQGAYRLITGAVLLLLVSTICPMPTIRCCFPALAHGHV